MSTIRVVNLQHTDATEPNIVLESDGTAVFASGITVSGGANLTISGIAEFASGTVSAPTITFIDDNNTGIYEPAVDTVAITTAATERLRVDNSGNVVIGSTTANSKFHVNVGTNQNIAFNSDGSNARISAFDDAASASVPLVVNGSDLRFTTETTERMRIDSSGNLLIGTSTSLSTKYFTAAFAPGFQNAAAAGTGGFYRYSNNGDPAAFIFSKSKATTIGNHTIVAVDETLGYLGFTGSDGAAFQSAAAISCQVDGTPGVGDMPGRLVFYTTPDGSTSPAERMRLTNQGVLLCNQTVSSPNLSNLSPFLQVNEGSGIAMSINRNSGNDGFGANIMFRKSRSTDADGTTSVNSGDSLGQLQWTGTEGTQTVSAASVQGVVAATPSPGYIPGEIRFITTNTSGSSGERLRVQANGGISFNGDSAAANALNDYEEGTWTPQFATNGVPNSGATYSVQVGEYTKIGNTVFVRCRCTLSSVGTLASPTAQAGVIGLPFTVRSVTEGWIGATVGYVSGAWNTAAPTNSLFAYNSTGLNLYTHINTSAQSTMSSLVAGNYLTNTSDIILAGTYITDA